MLLKRNGRTEGEVRSYSVDLPDRGLAVLDRIDGQGWELTVRLGEGVIQSRGLFSTPKDAVAVLDAEYNLSDSD